MQIFSHINVSAPIWLCLIPPAWLLFRRRYRGVGWCRTAALTALALAAADVTVRWRGNSPRQIELKVEEVDAAPRAAGEKRVRSGDPADALAAAGAAVGPDEGADIRIHCAPDDIDLRLARTARLLNRRGIRVFVSPLEKSPAPTGLLRLEHPPVGGAGETVPVSGTFAPPELQRESEFAVLDEDGEILARTERKNTAGRTEFLLHLPLKRPGMRRFRLHVNGRETAVFRVLVRKPYRALLISKDPGDAAALRRILDGRAQVDLHPAQSDLMSYPLYIFGSGGAGLLSAPQLEKIASRVRSGSGMLLLCGRELPFDPETVPRSFADLSPVRYSGRNLNRVPATALVIIIDTSGSMSGSRIALARETARLAVDRLRECDMAGVVEFHGRRRWAAPLQSAANQLELHRALNRLSAGGGTVLLPALREAFYALRNVDARLKHILILTDGGFERGDFASLLRRMAAYDITVSTVMTGPGRSDFLARLAVWGNGRHYNAADRFAIPELIFRQSGRETLPPYRDGAFAVTVPDGSPTPREWPEGIQVSGIWESKPRQGAEPLLYADQWPLLVRRAEGAGHVAALNTDLAGTWSRRLSGHPAFTGLLAALSRRLPDPVRLGQWDFRDRSSGKDAEFLIDAPSEIVELEAELSLPDGGMEKFRLSRNGGEPFRFRRNDLAPGEYELTVRNGDRAERIPFAIRTARGVGSGDIAAEINRRSGHMDTPRPAWRSLRLRPFFGLIFILLALTQVGLRRVIGALPLLLTAVVPPAFGDDFSLRMLRGMRSDDAKEYRAAAAIARSPADRRMALLLWLDAVRGNAVEYRELLARWKTAAATDPECLALLLDELEDQGRLSEVLELLENTRFGGDVRFARRLIRLAEKCGKSELIRRRAETALAAAPCDQFWMQTAVRLELLAGDRQAAKRRLESGIAAAVTSEELTKLIAVAEDAALYSAALDAVGKLEYLNAADPWAARFRKLEILRRQGDPERALAALRQWSVTPVLPPGAVMKAADWCEQLGDSETALRFYARSEDGEAVIRQAMLLQSLGRDAEALELWWRSAVDPAGGMRALQAMENCIALAGAARNLPMLVRRIHRELTETGSRSLYRFYCRALAASGDEKTLFAFLSARNLERMRLDFLLELKHYSAAVELIDRLRAQYPAEAESLLRRKLLIAVENQDRALAQTVVADLFAASGDRVAALEYAAGAYSLLGDNAGALRFYDECLALAPDRIELYLLRANAQKACGSGAAATVFFRNLLTPETPTDLFGVAVDGLLNLDAPAPELRGALTAVLDRLRREPEQIFFYQLADDLAETLGDTECRRKLLFRQLAVAPERRGLLLRQLFLSALAQSNRPEALRYAGLLLGSSEIYAPELYVLLSRFLIENGRFATAERCVRDADAAEDSVNHLFDFVGTCLETGRLDDADRICRELLSLHPDSPELLTRYAAVKETGNELLSAGKLNLAALKLLASRVAPGAEREQDLHNDPSRQLQPLIRAFAHQSALFPEEFSAELARLSRTASPGARRMIWHPVRARIQALRTFPAASVPPARKVVTVDPSELAAKLAILPSGAAETEFFAVLDRMPPARKNTFLPRLVGALSVSPSPAVEARLRKEIDSLKLRDGKWDWPLISGAIPLKLMLAETFLRQYPESFYAQILLARTRWAAGDAAGARRLAAIVFERFTELNSFNLPLIRAIRELNPVFGAAGGSDGGTGALLRSEWINELAGDEKLLGTRPARRLLLALLLDGAGEYDASLDLMFRMWREGERTIPIFRLMEVLTLKTGRGNEFIQTLRTAPPKDAAVSVLYARRLAQLLRENGDYAEAREYLSSLPETLRRSEQLLLDREQSAPEKFSAALRRFLTEQCRNGGTVGVIDDEFGLGGLRGMRRRGDPRKNRLFFLSDGVRNFGEVLDYLLRGIPVTEPGFAVIFAARCQLSAPSYIPAAVTPAETALKSAAGEALSPEESRGAAALVQNPQVPPETAFALLLKLPPAVRTSAADALARRLASGRMLDRQLVMLEKIMPLTSPETRSFLAKKLQVPDSGGYEVSVRLVRLALTARWIPEQYQAARETIIGRSDPAENTDLYLVFGSGEPEMRFRRYFASEGGFPDWERILPLIAVPERETFIAAAAAALEAALRDGHLPADMLVRHYVLLAAASPEHAARYMAAAARHDRRPGEASLWRLDILTGQERHQLGEQLQRAGRLMPIRKKCSSTNQSRKGPEK